MKLRAVAAAAIALGAAPAHAQAQTGADAIRVVGQQRLDARLTEYRLRTPALPGESIVRVLLPDGYAKHPGRRYPALYLLHGCCDFDVDGAQAWTTHGKAEEITAGKNLIVVMPAGGRGGIYSDWISPGSRGRPQWETYHMGQLVPWVDRRLRTKARREGRVIAGLSMGGFGAMKYAALHPDMFVAAASFSGIVDSNVDNGGFHASLPAFDGGTPASVWGARATNELRWRSENPWDLAQNFPPLRVALRTGNGQPGPLDQNGRFDAIEAGVHKNSVSLHERLAALGIRHTWDDYGAGTHTWPYWSRDLERTLSEQLAVLADPPAPPRKVTYTTARPAYRVFGWRVAWKRDGLAFTKLIDASRRGFRLQGEGAAKVRTPPRMPKRARVKVDGKRVRVRRDAAGRLTIAVHTGSDGKATVRISAPRARPQLDRR